MPDYAPPLAPNEQELVDKMQTTVSNAQARALQQQAWDQESLALIEQRLHQTVQARNHANAPHAFEGTLLFDLSIDSGQHVL